MRKVLLYLTAIAACTFIWNACSNDFELTAPWKEIPVVYGILSPADTAHYLRIEKAFLDQKTSALQVAGIADSLYYPENAISVYLQKVGNTKRYQMYRVDGNKEGYVRQDGVFATSPNWLYKIKPSELDGGLEEGSTYRLIIQRADGQPDITAETVIPKKFVISSPAANTVPPKIEFRGDNNTNFRWSHDINAVYFNVFLTVPYREEIAGQIVARDTIRWKAIGNVEVNPNTPTSTLATVKGTDFYTVVANRINQRFNNDVTEIAKANRYFDIVTVEVEGGGREIKDYLLTKQANSGLTGAEIINTYTNLSEGYGLLSSKNKSGQSGYRIWEMTIDSMQVYPPTKLMNWKFF